MEPKHKHEWDYLGWKNQPNYSSVGYYQKDWNQTILTKINQTSAQIFKESQRGGANLLIVHPKTFCLLKTLEYFHQNGSECFLSGRFKILVDDSIDSNKIIVKHRDEVLEKIKLKLYKPNMCYAINIKDDEYKLKFVELIDETQEVTEDGFKIITESMLTGEINVLNYNMIDPVTGEINIDYHNEIPSEIWLPSPNIHESTSIDIDVNKYKLMEEARTLINNRGDEPRMKFTIPINPITGEIDVKKERKSFMQKIKELLKIN